jgi:1,2-diacylglycerol 3-alpha-glucosyltransferase
MLHLEGRARRPFMKIAWISSWAPRPCGIASYSAELVGVLRKKGNQVHIICHPDGGSPGERHVHPVMDTRRPGWDEEVYEVVKKIQPHVLHIQHEYGLYQTNRDHGVSLFRPLFRWKMDRKFPVVVTYHSVYERLNAMMSRYMDVMQGLVDAGIVHEAYQWFHLPVHLGRVYDNVYVIPHGARDKVLTTRRKAKESLGLKGEKVIGMIGWFHHTKGFHRVLERWDSIAEKLDESSVLVLAGEARQGDQAQLEYKEKLLSLVGSSRFKDRIRVILGSFEPDEYERILASFDIMVMPYSNASQSGNLANSFSVGVPVVATAMEGLKAEIEESGAGVGIPPGDDDELEQAIFMLIANDSLREKYSKRARDYVKKKISWSITVDKHLRLYRKLIKKIRTPLGDMHAQVTLEV